MIHFSVIKLCVYLNCLDKVALNVDLPLEYISRLKVLHKQQRNKVEFNPSI